MVHESYVPKSKYVAGEAVAIRCAHGDTVMYPITIIDVVVSSIPLQVEAAVSTSLPVSMLLGTDVPELNELLQKSPQVADALVMTRAQVRQQDRDQRQQTQTEATCDVHPTPVATNDEEEDSPKQPTFDRDNEKDDTPEQPTIDPDDDEEEDVPKKPTIKPILNHGG